MIAQVIMMKKEQMKRNRRQKAKGSEEEAIKFEELNQKQAKRIMEMIDIMQNKYK